jgi:hypothetical protein
MKTFNVRIHETITSRQTRTVEIDIPAQDEEHARNLAQACYPGLLPPEIEVRIVSDETTGTHDHQVGRVIG